MSKENENTQIIEFDVLDKKSIHMIFNENEIFGFYYDGVVFTPIELTKYGKTRRT